MSDEEKKAIKEIRHFNKLTRYWQEEEYEEKEIARYIRIILNLIEKQSKEIEEYKKQLDLDYVDKNFIRIDKIKAKIEEEDKLFFRTKDVRHANRYKAYKELLEKE